MARTSGRIGHGGLLLSLLVMLGGVLGAPAVRIGLACRGPVSSAALVEDGAR